VEYNMINKNNQKKFVFKNISKKDLEVLQKWRNSKEIFPYNTQFKLLNSIDQKNWYEMIQKPESDRKMFVVKMDKKLIGVCGLIHLDIKNKNADVALIIGELQFQGKGLGKQILKKLLEIGFKKFGLNRIGAEIIDYNEKSEIVFKKLNFQLECKLRESIWRYGKWHDINIYSILRDEF